MMRETGKHLIENWYFSRETIDEVFKREDMGTPDMGKLAAISSDSDVNIGNTLPVTVMGTPNLLECIGDNFV